MPNKEFLERYPLYRKYSAAYVPPTSDQLTKVAINMMCEQCASNATFLMVNQYWEGHTQNFRLHGRDVKLTYKCVQCEEFTRTFLVRFDPDGKWLMKTGQFPAWSIEGDSNLEQLLGNHKHYYQRGLICESQGYGIGAFGYYRRIVEEVIDALLDDVSGLLAGEELAKYEEALKKTKQTIVTQEKIELVKELLPPILRPDGMNPLQALHSSLSEGLHAQSDEECLEKAVECRQVLIFLVTQVAESRRAGKQFTESMRKLLEKKAAAAKPKA